MGWNNKIVIKYNNNFNYSFTILISAYFMKSWTKIAVIYIFIKLLILEKIYYNIIYIHCFSNVVY